MERKRRTAVAAAGTLAAAAVVIAVLVNLRSRDGVVARPANAAKAWYTADDGRTWFADQADKVVPFDHGGKPAYRCYVWSCDGGKTKFVSHLERPSPTPRQQSSEKTLADLLEPQTSKDVKPPGTGATGWIPAESPQASRLLSPMCPDGKGARPQPAPAE